MRPFGQTVRWYWDTKIITTKSSRYFLLTEYSRYMRAAMSVPSKINPADDASRGLDVNKNISSSKWFKGPEFL